MIAAFAGCDSQSDSLVESAAVSGLEEADQFLETRPELKARYNRVTKGDGNTQEIQIPTRKPGEFKTVKIGSVQKTKEALGAGILQWKSRTNQEALYRRLYEGAPVAIQATVKSPKDAANNGVDLFDDIRGITNARKKYGSESVVTAGPYIDYFGRTGCAAERGYQLGSDMEDDSTEPNPTSPFAYNDFPLKSRLSCIRDQGTRASGDAFAFVAVAEILKNTSTLKYNMSEQNFYFWAKVSDGSIGVDGLDTWEVAQDLVDTSFPLSAESYWNYNQSLQRYTNSAGDLVDSCEDYEGELCTETFHQGKESMDYVFDPSAMRMIREYTFAPPSPLDTSGPRFTEAIQFFEPAWSFEEFSEEIDGTLWEWRTNPNVDMAKLFLDDGRPVLLNIGITEQFFRSGGAMTVEAVTGWELVGDQTVVLVGYVDNEDLHEDMAVGYGGGYFIGRNSWGTSWGDAGYFYLEYDYLDPYFVQQMWALYTDDES